MKKIYIIFLIFAFLLFTFDLTFAARPFSLDDTGTTYTGGWKLEGGVDSSTLNSSSTTSLLVTGKYGLLSDMELQIGGSYQSTGSTSGRGPIKLGLKYRFNEEKGTTPSFGVKGSISMPESEDSIIDIRGILTDTMRDFVYHINLGIISIGSVSGISYGGALDYPVKDDVNLVCELSGGTANVSGSSVSQLGGMVGGKWKIKKGMTLDGALKFGLNSDTPSGFTIGITSLL